MTITTTTNRVQYSGDGATTSFTFNFRCYATTDLKVYTTVSGVDTLQVMNTGYTASVNATTASPGGTITFAMAPAIGTTITIFRDLPYTQGTSFTVGGPLPSATLEQTLDRLTLLLQDLAERVDRRTPDYEVTSSGTANY